MKRVKVSDVARVRMGETLISKNLTGDGLPVYSAGKESKPWGFTSSGRLKLTRGTIVLSARGSIGFPKIPLHDHFTATQTTIVVEPSDRSVIDPEYLCYSLSLVDYGEFTRAAAIPMITVKQVSELTLDLPQVSEQRRIVARIKECMERVAEVERLRLAALGESSRLAPAVFEAIEQDNEWPSLPVGHVVARTRNGRSIRQDTAKATGFVLSLAAVRDVILNCEAKKSIPLPEQLRRQYAINEGDVFVSRANTRELVGLASIADSSPEGVIFPDLLIKLETKPDLIRPRFLAYALRTRGSRRQIMDRAVGTSQSMVKISADRLKEVCIRVPSLEDQDILLERLDAADSLSTKLAGEMKSCESRHLRDAILRKAFAGEL